MDVFMLLIFLCFVIDLVHSGSYCYDNGRYFYCEYDCCGSDFDEYCCGVYSWIIGVAVVGGIIFIAFIVCVFCFCKKKQMTRGSVVHTTQQTQVQTMAVIHVPPPGYQPQPPPYYQQQQAFPPPPPLPQQGVYPPPPPANYGADPAYPPTS